MSGPLKWNRQQGLYIYRANRLVQHGGWNGLAASTSTRSSPGRRSTSTPTSTRRSRSTWPR